jgi:hypothetical protein
VHNLLKAVRREAANLLDQIVLIDSVELGTLTTLRFGKPASPSSRRTLPLSFGTPKVGGQAADDNRTNAAFVENIVLDNDVRTEKPGTRTRRCSKETQ